MNSQHNIIEWESDKADRRIERGPYTERARESAADSAREHVMCRLRRVRMCVGVSRRSCVCWFCCGFCDDTQESEREGEYMVLHDKLFEKGCKIIHVLHSYHIERVPEGKLTWKIPPSSSYSLDFIHKQAWRKAHIKYTLPISRSIMLHATLVLKVASNYPKLHSTT